MIKTIIFDFNGIIADPNFSKLITELPLVEKFSSLRVLLNLAKNPEMKKAFNAYKKGNIDIVQLQEHTAKFCPHSAYIVPKLLKIYSESVSINPDVVRSILELKANGVNVILMSNTTPETEQLIYETGLDEVFDGLIMSAKNQMVKPQPEIYEYAIKTYNLDPSETLMIDDKQKNLDVAEKFGIQTFKCKNTTETNEFLQDLIFSLDIIAAM